MPSVRLPQGAASQTSRLVYRASLGTGFALGLLALSLAAAPSAGAEPNHQPEASSDAAIEQRLAELQQVLDDGEKHIAELRHLLDVKIPEAREEYRQRAIEELVAELLDDRSFRDELYPDLTRIGYDDGLYIETTTHDFMLNITGMMQVRWTGSNRQTDNRRLAGSNRQDDLNGFEVQYLILNFDGYLKTPKWTYFISVIGDTDQGNNWQTYYAFASYEFFEQLILTAGLVDLPQGFNNLVADHKQQFVDRALAEEVYNVGPSVGVTLSGLVFDRLEYVTGVFNGINNPYDSPSQEQLDTNFAYAASLIVHLLGDGAGDDETDLAFSKDPIWDVGLNMAYNDDNGDSDTTAFYVIPERIRRGRGIGTYGEADLTGTDLLQFGGHTAFRYRGFSLTAEYYVRSIDSDTRFSQWERLTGRRDATHQQGGYVEGGYFIIPKKLELAARLGGLWDLGRGNAWEYTFGVNYYPTGSHHIKLQADITRIEEAPLDSQLGNWFQNDDLTMFRVAFQTAF